MKYKYHLMNTVRLFVLFLALEPILADAGEIDIRVQLSPAGSFTAKSAQVSGKISSSGGVYSSPLIEIPISSFSTGIGLRDQHFKEYLSQKGTIKNLKLTQGKCTGSKGEGEITLNQVTKKIAFECKVSGKTIEASFKLKATDYGLPEKEYLGVGVEDEVDISVRMPL